MSESYDGGNRSLDILGIKPIGQAVYKLTDASINGAASFLSRICLPAAEEFGLLLRDRVRAWRAANLTAVLSRAEAKLDEQGQTDTHAHPKIVATILEESSWVHDSEVQDMWAGLLSSACTDDGSDDSNLIFVNLLSQISSLQARLLNYACQNTRKKLAPNGLVIADGEIELGFDELCVVAGDTDMHRIDRELDHLRNLGLFGLFGAGFKPDVQHLTATLTPSALALHLYVRTQGSRMPPNEFYGLQPDSDE